MMTLDMCQTILRLAKAGKPLSPEIIEALEHRVKVLRRVRDEKRKNDRRTAQRLFAGLDVTFDHLYLVPDTRIFVATVGPRVPNTLQACMLWGLGPTGREWGPRMIKAESELVEFAKR
ncbi:hypothetical protein CPT_Scapp_003 [Serratia phage Scapp]|uniref:Uncharacterized protein n=1 Tax=Serratia phage Scapp TaxID=2282409 RepID=A0A345L6N0_9CAUD|nr:hypothetical protein PP898_gp03 [Serratia phage Scapp]AXH50932.1 hypothetical protein CPT_Scapp_003 [Serratia phage Scapp]